MNPRTATIVALALIVALGATGVALAEPTVTATASVNPDRTVTFTTTYGCAPPASGCYYSLRVVAGNRLGQTLGSYLTASTFTPAGVFAAGCYTVEHAFSYRSGTSSVRSRIVQYVRFCVPTTTEGANP